MYRAAWLVFMEDVTTKKGTLYVLRHGSQDHPRRPYAGSASYSTGGDGPKPPASAIRFRTTDLAQAEREVTEYFLGRGFRKAENERLFLANQYVEFGRIPSGLLEVTLTTNVYAQGVADSGESE